MQNRPGVNFDLSEANLFYCGAPNSCAIGWQPDLAFKYLKTKGVGLEKAFPYVPGNQACQVIPPAVKVDTYKTAGTSVARKTALTAGPVVAAMAVYSDFIDLQERHLPPCRRQPCGLSRRLRCRL